MRKNVIKSYTKSAIIVLAVLTFSANVNTIFSQNEADQVYDVLNTTTTPAFMVMGVSNTEIARPTSLKDFTASLQNSTNGFTELPNTYGVEIRPIREDQVDDSSSLAWRHFTISLGFHREDIGEASEMTRAGIGLHIPIFRPKHLVNDAEARRAKENFNYLLQAERLAEMRVQLTQQLIMDQGLEISILNLESIHDSTRTEMLRSEQILATQMEIERLGSLKREIRRNDGSEKLRRWGGFLNLSMGSAWDYSSTFTLDSSLAKMGVWITSGFEGALNKRDLDRGDETSSWISGSMVLRWFNEPFMRYLDDDQVTRVQSSSALDFGLKLALTLFKGDLDCSLEALYRGRKNGVTDLKHTNKYMLNVAYSFNDDFKLSFSFGKDFENQVSKDGNLISLLNVIKGIGK